MEQDLRLTLTQSVLTASAGVPACMVLARNLCFFFNDLYWGAPPGCLKSVE